jgi:elongation factor 3
VLAASMWLNPHLVILDEPTNYLDRDGLGALTKAIKDFKGGVVIISHNREFADAVSQEKWIMDKGHLIREGESVGNQDDIIVSGNGNTMINNNTIKDKWGNELNVQNKVLLNDKEKRKEIKNLEKLLKKMKKTRACSEDIYSVSDRLDILKEG